MITKQMMNDYDEYLDKHINAVKTAFSWICENLYELVKPYDVDMLGELISDHDSSKYDDEEYIPYCEYFYGDRTPEIVEEFDFAWLHHQHNNPHHWQHWILREDDGDLKALEMPYLAVLEMICDHWAFSWVSGDLNEIFNWYELNKDKMVLHENTRALYEEILSKIKEKLN